MPDEPPYDPDEEPPEPEYDWGPPLHKWDDNPFADTPWPGPTTEQKEEDDLTAAVRWDPGVAPPLNIFNIDELAARRRQELESALPFGDITTALTGGAPSNDPGILYRDDGQGLYYPRAVNTNAGEPGEGKTTVSCMAVVATIASGRQAIFLDAEDVIERVLARLVALGADLDDLTEHFRYITYSDLVPESSTIFRILADYVTACSTTLVVIDGIADVLGAHGLDEDRASDYAKWHALVAKPLSQAGAAVVLNDHMAKAKEGRGLWPRGSGHKLAAVDGIAYHVSAPSPFSRDHDGVVQLTISKDRAGHVGPKKTHAARILIDPRDNGTRIIYRILKPQGDDTSSGDTSGPEIAGLDPAFLEEVVVAIAASIRADGSPGPTRNRIIDELRSSDVRFDDRSVTPALLRLSKEGRIVRTPRKGGQGHTHSIPQPDDHPEKG